MYDRSLEISICLVSCTKISAFFCGLGLIGPEVEAVHREFNSEQRTLRFLFEGFWPSNEVILFLRIP